MRRLAIALVHHPVLDAKGKTVTSALTNIDVHDLARSARTYGCSDFFVVHPIEMQRLLTRRIVEHWTTGSSAARIPDRKEALSVVRAVATLDGAVTSLGALTWVTAAREIGTSLSWTGAREQLQSDGPPIVLVFGTAWGLTPDVTSNAAAVLPPIVGTGEWNHLSVRAACAISLDRLLGTYR